MLRDSNPPRPRWWLPLALGLCVGGCQLAENLAVNLAERLFSTPERTGKLVDGKHEGEWVFRYPEGQLQAKGSYVNDRQVGPWTYWYDNENVEWQGEYLDERLNGPTLFGYRNGKRQAIGLFFDGLEEGLWTFWNADGELVCEGDFVRGQPGLRWSYFHPDGALMAEGYRLAGERIGPWQFYSTEGELSERRFPMPEETEIVFETWDGAVPRREGFLAAGVQEGRWVTCHPNGRRRLTADLVNGKPHGVLVAWTDEGLPVARGRMERGRAVGPWHLWRGEFRDDVDGSALELEPAFAGEWSRTGSMGAASPERTLSRWLGELLSPSEEPVDLAPNPNVPAPPPDLVEATDSIPSYALRPQPWTVREAEAIDFLVARYSDGARNRRPPSGYGRARTRNRQEEEGGDPVLSPRFIGTELPWTRFYSAEGNVVDMDEFRGKKKVVLVVLRGMAREVCVYCVTQTEALCDNIEDFEDQDCEVFVLYPGEQNRLETFMESFQKVSKHMGKPPVGVIYDRNMELVRRMGISSEFAIPSTFVLDERGVIRYSYVGTEIDDRPPAQDVLDAIRKLGT